MTSIKMQYKFLGNTGLKVSVISFGNWLNSDDKTATEKTTKLLQKAWDLGINYFDTAEVYGAGEAERQFGVALKNLEQNGAKREQYILSTKLFWGPDVSTNPNGIGLSRKHIIEGLKASLNRLQQNYADIVFCHRFDNQTPIEETCRAFDWLIKQGLCHYWGTSEWTAANIFECFAICNQYDLVKPVADQCQYNMMVRDKMEIDYARLFDIYGYGTTVFSPLMGGLLTGKYNQGVPEESRYNLFKDLSFIKSRLDSYFSEVNKPKYIEMFKGLAEISKELNCTQAQLAMAWVIKYQNTSTALTGASRPEQLEDIVGAVEVVDKLTPQILERIEKIIQTRPPLQSCARGGKEGKGWGPIPSRR